MRGNSWTDTDSKDIGESKTPGQNTHNPQNCLGLRYSLSSVIELSYEAGTLLASGGKPPEPFVWDKRTEQWRAPAGAYREVALKLRNSGTPYKDRAASFEKLSLESRVAMEPRPYQRQALNAWRREELRGVVVLPTG